MGLLTQNQKELLLRDKLDAYGYNIHEFTNKEVALLIDAIIDEVFMVEITHAIMTDAITPAQMEQSRLAMENEPKVIKELVESRTDFNGGDRYMKSISDTITKGGDLNQFQVVGGVIGKYLNEPVTQLDFKYTYMLHSVIENRTYQNITLEDKLLKHVTFINCEFINVKVGNSTRLFDVELNDCIWDNIKINKLVLER